MVRYLSLEWIDALGREVAARPALAVVGSANTIGVTQLVTDGPEGDVVYHLQATSDGVSFGAGPAEPEDVRMEQSWETAVGVATGTVNAQEAFVTGRILLSGDQARLLAVQPLFGALAEVFATVGAETDYR
jgi:putative sterol carrier protein